MKKIILTTSAVAAMGAIGLVLSAVGIDSGTLALIPNMHRH